MARLHAQVEKQGDRISLLVEKYNRAVLAKEAADQQLKEAEDALVRARAEAQAVDARSAPRP